MGLEALGMTRWVAEMLVYLVTVLELYVGTILVLKIDLQFALRVAFGIIFIFAIYLFYLSTLANPPSCGCLGLSAIFKSTRHQALIGLTRNVAILWAVVLASQYYFPEQKKGLLPSRQLPIVDA
jgi:hypothetical protein